MSRLLLTAVTAVLAIAACGEVKTNELVDGGGSGSGAGSGSGSGSGGAREKVTVHVLDAFGSGGSVTGAEVVFIDSGAVGTTRAATDANGSASGEMAEGGSVTVITGENGQAFIQTVLGVKPGDDIHLGFERQTFTSLGSFTVKFTPVAGATGATYTVFGPCGSIGTTTGTATLSFNSNCGVDMMDFIVVGVDANSNSLGFLEQSGVPFVKDGSVTIAGSFKSQINFAASYTNAGLISSINMSRLVPFDDGFESGDSGPPAQGSVVLTALGPTASSAVVQTGVNRTNFAGQEISDKIAGNATTYGLDVQGAALPWMAKATFDVPSHTAKVTVATDGSSADPPDVFFCDINYRHIIGGTGSGSGGTPLNIEWLVIAGAPGDVTLPDLSADVGDLRPTATDTFEDIFLEEIDSDAFAGYAEARLKPYNALENTQPRQVTHRLRVSEIESEGK